MGALYSSLGGGLIFSGNGVGPGVYSAFGYNFGDSIAFNMEYKQAVGINGDGALISPYALRIGVHFPF